MSPCVPLSLEGQKCQSGVVYWRAGPVRRFLSQVTCICTTRSMCVESHARRVLRWLPRAVVNILKCFPYVSQEERVYHQMEVLQVLLRVPVQRW